VDRISVNIAGIVFAISSDGFESSIHLARAYEDFLSSDPPEITIKIHNDGLPIIIYRDQDKIFDSEMVWSLYLINGQYVLTLKSPSSHHQPYRIAIFDEQFRHGDVYSNIPETGLADLQINPLEFPLSEVLMVCLLAQGRGLMVHACGVDDHGRGYLLTGNSTHGKSTMAKLWQDEAAVLNDDRIVLRQMDGRFLMYGTPWHGDYSGVAPGGVPLEKIFYLRHANTNETIRKDGIAAASMLLTRSFPPLWDGAGMLFTLDLCAHLVEAVPCFELGFVPDKDVLELMRNHLIQEDEELPFK